MNVECIVKTKINTKTEREATMPLEEGMPSAVARAYNGGLRL